MSGKYMKVKKIVIPTLTLILISSMLFGVSACSKKEAKNMSQQASEIEIEYAVPDYDSNIKESKVELLPWLQLASLETHPELRSAFEKLVGITVSDDGTKSGCIYTNAEGVDEQNNTLFVALGNASFASDALKNDDNLSKIDEIAGKEFADLEDSQSLEAVINSYFELLPDQEDGKFDGDSTINRAQAMTLVMRATTQVNDEQAPKENEKFTDKVGETTYTNFAAPMDKYSYINTSNGLNEKSFSSTMTRGEYIYMLTKTIFGDDYANRLESSGKEDTSSDSKLSSIKDGGDISYKKALSSPEKGVPTEMYNTLAKAVSVGFVKEDNLNWDDAITKSDAVSLLVDAIDTYYTNTQYNNDSFANITKEIEASYTEKSTEQPANDDYPDNNPQHQKAWDNFKENWNESDYGTTTKGKTKNDFPYYGPTGYDLYGTILQECTTDKGYTVMYDTNTGRVYYSGMTMPDGSLYADSKSDKVLVQYLFDNDLDNIYDLTYSQMQELLGTYSGD